MKKLVIIFCATALFFTACNNNKTAGKETTNEKTTENKDSRDDDSKDSDTDNKSSNNSKGWTAIEINSFVTSCTDEAVSGGMARSAAEKYCNCMQEKLEKKYPSAAEVASLDLESEETKALVMECLN